MNVVVYLKRFYNSIIPMLWLGQRARQLARVVLVPPRASAPHQLLRNPGDQPVARGVAHNSLLSLHNQPHASSDIGDVSTAQDNARLPSPESSQPKQLIGPQQQERVSAHTHQTESNEAVAEHLITTLRRALQHRNGGAAQARATASANVVHHLSQPAVLAAAASNPQLTSLILQDLARCGPLAPPLLHPATPALHHLLTARATDCPPDTLLCNMHALIKLNVPLPKCTALHQRLHDAVLHASPSRVADVLWYATAHALSDPSHPSIPINKPHPYLPTPGLLRVAHAPSPVCR